MKPRAVGMAGAASVLLLLPVTALLLGTGYPFADAPPSDVVEYLARHRPAFMSAIVIEFASIILLGVFVAGIASYMPPHLALVTMGAGMLTVLLSGLEIATLAAAAFRPMPEVVAALWPLAHFGVGVLLHVTTALFVAAATLGLSFGKYPFLSERLPRRGVAGAGFLAIVGNAIIPLGYFGRSVDFVAGVIEHAASTLPYVVWVVIVSGLAILMENDDRRSPYNSRLQPTADSLREPRGG